jgi:hypothetical protein
MKKCLPFGVIMLAAFCCGAAPVFSQERPAFSRRVVGYVKDRENHPVVGAKVCANPHGPVAGRIPCGVSKANGRFALDVWWADTFTVSAEDLKEGYPNAYNAFYGSFFGELPVITVDESGELSPVEVRVGPKAGRVRLKIVDDESGQPLESGSVEVCRVDKPKQCEITSTSFPRGVYEFLTPEVAFTLKLQVWGVGGWEDRDAVDENNVRVEWLQVELGTTKELNVRLKRPQ